MQFIRDNLFYVVLVGVVVVGAAVLLAVGVAVGGSADAALASRNEVDTRLTSIERGQPINKGAVEAEKKRVEKVDAEAKLVEAATLKWNRGEYPMFETQDFKPEGKPFPAFRQDPPQGGAMTPEKFNKWKKDNAEWQKDAYGEHTAAYIAMMTKLVLQDLRSTRPPSQGLIKRERDGRLFRLINERADKVRAAENLRSLAGAAGSGRGAAPKPGEEPRVLHQIPTRELTAEAQAEADARNQLTLTEQEKGYIYADLRSLNPIYVEADSTMLRGARVKLWGAWVHYRICRDITAAIRETITDVLKTANVEAAKATVSQSPIKRLVDVRVNYLPYTGGNVVLPEGKGVAMSVELPHASGSAGPGKGGGAPCLTGRTTDNRYDVIRYQFTVVMADKYVGQLIERLYRQNDHFVESFRMVRVETGSANRAGGMIREGGPATGADTMDESLCYYGVEPVMRVTFDGELLMRTGWCRDLMPEEVLSALKAAAPMAMRPQDNARVIKALQLDLIRTGSGG